MTGLLKIRTTKEFGESTVSKILDLVENASSRKSRPEDFISKFARIYTPAVCIAALALALLPPLGSLVLGMAPLWEQWVYRALTFLVIFLPLCLGYQYPSVLLRGNRRRQQCGRFGEGFQLSGSPVPDQNGGV